MIKYIIFGALMVHVFAQSDLLDITRIVNGTRARLGEIPYIISLRYHNVHTCGGSILTKRHVLTAAHCVVMRNPDTIQIQYGVLYLWSNKNIIKVDKAYTHENFDILDSYANDVAVLKLVEEMVFNKNVQPIKLPKQDEKPPGGNDAVLAGWGYDKSGGSMQGFLNRVNIILYTDENCRASHGTNIDPKYHVCAGIPEGGKGQCNGDSGGPLVSNGKQWGIVSWSIKPCARVGFPGVFARVSSYVDWIKEKQNL